METRNPLTKSIISGASIGTLLTAIIGDPVVAYHVEELLAKSPKVPEADELMKIDGVGMATALKVQACCELSAHYFVGTKAESVTSPEDVERRLAFLRFEQQEHFVVVTLDSSNHIIGTHEITKGLVNQTPVAPREVFRVAIMDNAVSVIIAHNHPSGSLEPSEEDIAITRLLCSAGKIMKIPVLDHLVVTRSGTTSLCRRDPSIFEQAA